MATGPTTTITEGAVRDPKQALIGRAPGSPNCRTPTTTMFGGRLSNPSLRRRPVPLGLPIVALNRVRTLTLSAGTCAPAGTHTTGRAWASDPARGPFLGHREPFLTT
jgi:hypothetical protein